MTKQIDITYDKVLATLKWHIQHVIIPSLPVDCTLDDYIKPSSNYSRLGIYRYSYKGHIYVQTIKPDNTIEKLPAEIYDLDNEDNIMFGNYIFLSRKKFEDAYIEALSRLDDAKYFD